MFIFNTHQHWIKILILICIVSLPSFSQGTKFLHIANSANVTSNWTDIDHPLLNNNPAAVFIVTQNWNPPGSAGVYNNSPIGVWYNTSTLKWAIFNENLQTMPIGASFNVFIPDASNTFVHTANSANIVNNTTILDHPSLNNNNSVRVFITQNWNPPGSISTYNPSEVGVTYTLFKWRVFNQDLSAMPENASFNVFYYNGSDAFVHTANSANILNNWTFIDHPELNNRPGAIFFVTQLREGVYNDAPVGVLYDNFSGLWAIFNEDASPMPANAKFNVYLANSSVTAIDDRVQSLPESFELHQNYPNPFNPSTTITYSIPVSSTGAGSDNVTLKVYDVSGKEVATLVDEKKAPGVYEVAFNAGGLSSGVYFYRLQAGSYQAMRKMMLIK